MLRWALYHTIWFIVRCAVTLACVWTVNGVIAYEGYRVEFRDLLICAVALIVLMRFWMPRPYEKKKDKPETSWGG
jgi:hypothetical protein